MSKIEQAIKFMEDVAKDNSHGYDQVYRWNEKGDYDCSSLVITAWQNAGVPVKSAGATYTGNMKSVFLKNGFKDVTKSVNLSTGAGLKRGDVLLNEVHHVAMYCGNGKEVEASINEKGGARGGQPGDQTGQEIKIRSYRNYPWDCILRYAKEDSSTEEPNESTVSLLKKGSTGKAVKELQEKLNKLGNILEVDGDFGSKTEEAVKVFQEKYGLEVDGIVGSATTAELNKQIKILEEKTTENLNPVDSQVVLLFEKGQTVKFTGNTHYTSSYAKAKAKECKPGLATITAISKDKAHPYHLVATKESESTVNGWVDIKDVQSYTPKIPSIAETEPVKVNTSMKYTKENPPIVCMMTNSTCYLSTRTMDVKGILWHSTGANNPNLKRYVQPSLDDPNYETLIKKLGKNTYGNDWNHITHQAGLNAWIGKLADGTIATVQTMPWNYRPWGCGKGNRGTCNDNWIQFEICEDGLDDEKYFSEVYKEAIELTAYLCRLYKLDPNGTVFYNQAQIPVILCHADSYTYNVGSNHGDIYHWFKKYKKDMDTVRADVSKILKQNPDPEIGQNFTPTPQLSVTEVQVGDIITLKENTKYVTGQAIPGWVFKSTLYVREIRGKQVVFSTQQSGPVTGIVSINDITKKITGNTANILAYLVRITADKLNVRSGPSQGDTIVTTINKDEVYTIIETQGTWGKLKSGIGWINLNYTEKV